MLRGIEISEHEEKDRTRFMYRSVFYCNGAQIFGVWRDAPLEALEDFINMHNTEKRHIEKILEENKSKVM